MQGEPNAGRRLVAAIAVAALTVGAWAMSTDPSGAVDAAARRQFGRVVLELLDQDVAFPADGELRLVYRLAGDLADVAELAPPPTTTAPTTTVPAEPDAPGDEPEVVPPPELRLRVVNYEPLSTGDRVGRYVGPRVRLPDSDAIDGVLVPIDREAVAFEDDGSIIVDLAVGTDSGESIEELIDFDRPGLYPIVVSLIIGPDGEEREIARHGTIVQRLPGPTEPRLATTPVDLAVVTAIDEIGPEVSPVELRNARRELDAAFALTTGIDASVTLSVPPVVLADAAADDGTAVATALEGDELVSVPAAPLNISSAATADSMNAFDRQLQAGEDLLTTAAPTTPVRRDVWIATEPLSAAGAQQVRRLGYRYVIMTPAMFRATVDSELPETDLFVNIDLPDGGVLPLLVVDELGAALTPDATDEALETDTEVEWAVQTIAGMILERETLNPLLDRSRIIAAPDLSAPDPRLIAALEPLVRTTPSLRFSPAGTLTGVTDVQRVGGTDVTVELPDEAGPDLASRVAQLEVAGIAMVSVGSMLPDDDPRPAEWSALLSSLVSTGYTDDEVDAEVDGLLAEADRLKDSVVLPEPFTFTLTGPSSEIDLRFGNTSDEPLTVLVSLSSPKLSFPDGDRLVELTPNELTEVRVAVRARANGTSGVRVSTSTPAGELIDEPVVLTSRVNAFTGLGQVLTVGFVLVLLTWWFSHWRRRRRTATTEPADEQPGEPAGAGTVGGAGNGDERRVTTRLADP